MPEVWVFYNPIQCRMYYEQSQKKGCISHLGSPARFVRDESTTSPSPVQESHAQKGSEVRHKVAQQQPCRATHLHRARRLATAMDET